MKIYNKFVESKKEPQNKSDIWFDGSSWKMYKEGMWRAFTLPLDAAVEINKILQEDKSVLQQELKNYLKIQNSPFEKGEADNSAILKGGNNKATNANEVALGKYNKSNSDTYFSVGIGTSDIDRKNAFEVKQNGDIYIEGVKGRIQDKLNQSMILVTYAELVTLRDNGKLVAGMQYRITDYMTTTTQENTISAIHQFDVIVTADNENTLNEVARACHSKFDIERYKDAYSGSWDSKMLYIGTQEYEGKEYHLYEAESQDLQMLVDFDQIKTSSHEPTPLYPYCYFPSFAKSYDGSIWDDWQDGTHYGEAIQFKYELPSYFKSSKLESWQIWYSIDNDVERFAWADATNGKGVIYRMIDEWNNDCPYDFKNIKFDRGVYYGGGIAPDGEEDTHFYLFTFSFRTEDGQIIDTSIFGNNGRLLNDELQISGVYGNVIGQYMAYDGSIESPTKTTQRLNDIVFYSYYEYENDTYYGCYNNSFGNNCYSNSFGNSCHNNIFGNSCDNNSFGNDCYYNIFGNMCNFNSLGNIFSHNSFGDGCQSNSFKDWIGIADNFVNNKIDNGVYGVMFYVDNDKGAYGILSNHHICSGINNVTIDLYEDNICERTFTLDSNGELRSFILGDLASLL